MRISQLFSTLFGSSTGWKRAARVNCAVLIITSLILVPLSITAASYDNFQTILILGGDCAGMLIPAVNLALHLLINILSTLVLASANFFMQVLNAPSREELDYAHSKGFWFAIGAPSARNILMLPQFKKWCWVALLISSVPIHVLFNSTIFEIGYRGNDNEFSLTIATEDFIHGGPFFSPGASLFISGQQIVGSTGGSNRDDEFVVNDTAYGNAVSIEDYDVPESPIMQTLSKAAKQASTWTKIDPRTCWKSYINCRDLTRYRDLVVIIDKPTGWVRKDMWQLSTSQARFWDRYIPEDEPNHLFFHAQCAMELLNHGPESCFNHCRSALATQVLQNGEDYPPDNTASSPSNSRPKSLEIKPSESASYCFISSEVMSLVNGTAPSRVGEWNVSDFGYREDGSDYAQRQPGLQPDAFNLSAKYCLAETTDRLCHIALAPSLLLSVALTVAFKTVIALILTIVLIRRNQAPLVTLGDAVASFIENPDPVTVGFCILEQNDMETAFWSNELLKAGPRRWQPMQRMRRAAVPRSVWVSCYSLFIASITILGSLYVIGFESFSSSGFIPTDWNPPLFPYSRMTFIQAVLLANSPQLLLSLCYFAFNNLFTHLQMAKEWAMLSTEYRPLRVTDPQGEQFSTYRLQLPYKYSLSLMAISTVIHWVLSNTLYISITIQGYDRLSVRTDPILPPNTDVTIRYSAVAHAALLAASFALFFVPIFFSRKSLPRNSLNPAGNSQILSAACHVSTLLRNSDSQTGSHEDATELASSQPQLFPSLPLTAARSRACEEAESHGIQTIDAMATTEMQSGTDPEVSELSLLRECYNLEETISESQFGHEQGRRSLKKLSQSKIRWGVTKMTPEWYEKYAGDTPVDHLGFGVEEDMVCSPVSGNFYA
ncbi:hypothetical protein F5Y14DRAFT_419253 [Nemania sp. NC0429]|nr:hypothetical protein F5Y14DRAFT_419253 [Nemania sp. NC0429]